ncbi:hypothetical protein RRG08_033361 [Elysia crispata]|uniref:HAT C-terminal dimerisation domain-containing protein n=1 Tax=Elysia crispata TaxID=231223 RepID=A0AAE1DB76_9GAST|nr:hypothetical protein RRG08_033361 [Elysia crispata]
MTLLGKKKQRVTAEKSLCLHCTIHAEKASTASWPASTLSLLDPLAFGQTETGVILKRLPPFFPTIQAPDFNEEVMRMQSDMDIIVGSDADLDVWWNSVFKLKRYPSVEKVVVTACLSIFTGPRVEQSILLDEHNNFTKDFISQHQHL